MTAVISSNGASSVVQILGMEHSASTAAWDHLMNHQKMVASVAGLMHLAARTEKEQLPWPLAELEQHPKLKSQAQRLRVLHTAASRHVQNYRRELASHPEMRAELLVDMMKAINEEVDSPSAFVEIRELQKAILRVLIAECEDLLTWAVRVTFAVDRVAKPDELLIAASAPKVPFLGCRYQWEADPDQVVAAEDLLTCFRDVL